MPARRQSARKGSSPATASASAASVDLMSTLRLLPSLSLARSARWAPPRATAYMDAELAWRSTTDAFSAAATASMGSRFADLHESLAAAPCQLWVVRSVAKAPASMALDDSESFTGSASFTGTCARGGGGRGAVV